MPQPTQKKLNAEQIAHQFVLQTLARNLPSEAITEALDALTLWRGLRAHYASYAAHQDAIQVRPDEVAHMMPPGYWQGLPPETRKKVRNLINKEAASQQQGLAAVRRLIDLQVAALEAASPAFKDAYAEREQQYLTEDLSQAA